MIKKLELRNIRLFKKVNFEFNKKIVIFIGDNALGKTTILESIYFLCMLKSNRSNNDVELIKFNEAYGKITMNSDKEYMVALSNIGKKIFVNQNEILVLKDYIGLNNVVMFSPNDLNIVNGSPQLRRKFLDINLSQISKEYLSILQNYKKILKERNEMLKNEKIDSVLLGVINNSLLKEAKEIIKFRYEFINELNSRMINIGMEKVSIEYVPSLSYQNIVEDFNSSIENDLLTKSTNKGPHRDDIRFKIDNTSSSYASQGQVRSICLSLKLTLIDIIKKYKKKSPIVLLDDVLSELDDNRKNNLFRLIDNESQIFITSTDLNNLDKGLLENAQIIRLDKGGIYNGRE